MTRPGNCNLLTSSVSKSWGCDAACDLDGQVLLCTCSKVKVNQVLDGVILVADTLQTATLHGRYHLPFRWQAYQTKKTQGRERRRACLICISATPC
jgi:hypothetical protein